jgi:hypothetical protein
VRVCDGCFEELSSKMDVTPTSSKRNELNSESRIAEEDSDGDDDDDQEDDPYVSLRVRRGDIVDDNDLDDFNDWEKEIKKNGNVPVLQQDNRSENEKIATYVTAPIIKIAAFGENIRRMGSSFTNAFGNKSGQPYVGEESDLSPVSPKPSSFTDNSLKSPGKNFQDSTKNQKSYAATKNENQYASETTQAIPNPPIKPMRSMRRTNIIVDPNTLSSALANLKNFNSQEEDQR